MSFTFLKRADRAREKDRRTDDPERVSGKVWYDLHSHFLPGIDDGCRTVEESVALLEYSRQRGIAGMIATPHYYPKESIDRFLARRQAADEQLRQAIQVGGYEVPDWYLGAETAYYEGLVRAEGLDRLCLGHSRYLLLELPFEKWGSNVIRDIYTLSNVCGITPILAHLERYLDIQDRDMLEQVCEADVLIQMNAEYIIDRWSTRDAVKRIRNGYVQVLGSDAHNMRTRRPDIHEAVRILEQKDLADDLRRRNRQIFQEAAGGA